MILFNSVPFQMETFLYEQFFILITHIHFSFYMHGERRQAYSVEQTVYFVSQTDRVTGC